MFLLESCAQTFSSEQVPFPDLLRIAWVLERRRPVLVSARSSGVACVVPVQLDELAAFSSVRIYVPNDLRPPDARSLALKVHPFAPHLLTAMAPLATMFCLHAASSYCFVSSLMRATGSCRLVLMCNVDVNWGVWKFATFCPAQQSLL